VVEIGFLNGRSALNFLCALDADSRLYSFDFHSRQTLRCGITVLQRSAPLPRPPEPDRVSS
jgi:hypothetical protein